jgi:hypothetical protein
MTVTESSAGWQRLFSRFTGFDKTGQRAVHRLGKVGIACQQQLLASGHQHNHAGRDTRIIDYPARIAAHGSFLHIQPHRIATATTKLVIALPVQQLRGPPCQRK